MNQIEATIGPRNEEAGSAFCPRGATTIVARAPTLERPAPTDRAPREREPEAAVAPAALPIVSVIIVNYNYGRFLSRAVASVFAQTYPRIECILVDDASTDDSRDVIAACQTRHPSLAVYRREANGGQTSASLDGLARSSGPFVIFLDADDYLLPRCVETHVCVHLSSRIHVGFTSGDMLQIVDDQIVVSTNEPMGCYIRDAGPSKRGAILRPTRAALGPLWATFDASLEDRVYLVPPTRRDWVWSPTSGNCFRRDALDLFRDGDGLGGLRSQTDLYLAVGINAISGSILIDEPVFGYRLHGANAFSKRAQLSGMLAFDPSRTSANAHLARRLLIQHFVRRIHRFAQGAGRHRDMVTLLQTIDVADDTVKGPGWARRSHVARTLERHWSDLVETHGRVEALRLMARGGVPWHVLSRHGLSWLSGRKSGDADAAIHRGGRGAT